MATLCIDMFAFGLTLIACVCDIAGLWIVHSWMAASMVIGLTTIVNRQWSGQRDAKGPLR